ncbi:hypothetical protein A2331_03175 [Candidatus Falkowbacteria bacterium RIFOXYB2_FULL_34_18]|uniref:UPF0102 protein A2531_04540 n=1 Tax=Candidatus Falkowbacteria bacterium RIFOXYD2_FULL_34_120 TaxID=1798007 RepID=A0A1F5TP27_9BACT|nr:MAG: hypothetical protein A2500_00145 [Candidatus Falkowbacteria bacterium RIFOXYC12_FULL_34_55]OGF28634.1 MAG: hypothetical protein A2331_03175 [Candidatus Falkowbacteria bacterium RIFOXYB2_FULL_34_18]OGF38196.1 MAG: hypothetical protein A2466_00070 [Candidatus Falkowbacteria bacterium RIFOXYC2_FULL_34_220]OGF38306.1 MAG: hypothetical protein A2515_00815 [Candidatus Falkowbacteria bacterium RIFOXYD12_FULL_34_57]OGF40271.1 MAG: hypothetical protein A2531_04540 [Candidatus Falkowbacteria bact
MNHNQKIGKLGEDLACKYLQEKGYEILDRNIKTSFKEIDIVARIKEKIVFIEVKTRTNLKFGGADEAINHKKIKNLKKAIKMYFFQTKLYTDNFRLDLVAIDIEPNKNITNIKHYKDLF